MKKQKKDYYDILNNYMCVCLYRLQGLISCKRILAGIEVVTKNKYCRLMRLNNPTGYLLLVLPIFWVIVISTTTILETVIFIFLFGIGGLIARSAGCIINDIVDLEFDRKVSRTKNRPLASGEVSMSEALYILIFLGLLGMMLLFSLSYASVVLSMAATVMVFIYPFLKRYTNYTQIFLGLTFNLGILIAYLTVGTRASFNPVLIYIASVIWTVAYDTIYSLQDRDEDVKIGIKSMGIKYGERVQEVLFKLYSSFFVLLLLVGLNTNMNTAFYLLVGFSGLGLYSTVDTLQISNPADCGKKFKSNVYYGFCILLAFVIGKTYA